LVNNYDAYYDSNNGYELIEIWEPKKDRFEKNEANYKRNCNNKERNIIICERDK